MLLFDRSSHYRGKTIRHNGNDVDELGLGRGLSHVTWDSPEPAGLTSREIIVHTLPQIHACTYLLLPRKWAHGGAGEDLLLVFVFFDRALISKERSAALPIVGRFATHPLLVLSSHCCLLAFGNSQAEMVIQRYQLTSPRLPQYPNPPSPSHDH